MTDKESPLLHCPLCGGEASHGVTPGYYGGNAIMCEDCCLMFEYGNNPRDKEEAIIDWNTRTTRVKAKEPNPQVRKR